VLVELLVGWRAISAEMSSPGFVFLGSQLIDVIAATFTLSLFDQQVVSWGDLIVLVVLNVSFCLFQMFALKMFRQLGELLRHYWNWILAHDQAIQLSSWRFLIPFVAPNVLNGVALLWIGFEDFDHEVFVGWLDKWGHIEVARQDLFVKFVRVGVFEWQITTRHGVEDDSTRPNVGAEARIPLAGNHFGRRVAGRSARCFEQLSLFISVTEAKVNYLYVVLTVQQ
jgi:hypothetical protein